MSEDIAKYIDHTLVKPNAEYGRFTELCREALQYKFHSVCVNSFYVPLVSKWLQGQPTQVCSVIGYPLGASSIITRSVEASDAIANGASEIDAVINIGALKTGDYKRVRDELWTLRDVVKDKVLKIIVEAPLLTEDEIKKACDLCVETECDYAKTSTGMIMGVDFTGEKTIQHADLMKRHLKDTSVKVKAAGGITTLKDVKTLISLGIDRIGSSRSVDIMKEMNKGVEK